MRLLVGYSVSGHEHNETPPPNPLPEAGRGERPFPPPRFGEGVRGRGSLETFPMALDLTVEQKELGKGNANVAAGELTRRGFMKSMAIGAAGLAPVAAATYYGYET